MKTITERIDLGMGLTAIVEYEDIGPSDPPQTGVDWPTDVDLPRCRATLRLPTGDGGQIATATVSPTTRCFGEKLISLWGHQDGSWRAREIVRTSPRISDAYDACRVEIADAIAVVRTVVMARAARLAAREKTIEMVREGSPFSE